MSLKKGLIEEVCPYEYRRLFPIVSEQRVFVLQVIT